MTEADSPEIPQQKFNITPKTPYSEIAKNSNMRDRRIGFLITQDICKNVEELTTLNVANTGRALYTGINGNWETRSVTTISLEVAPRLQSIMYGTGYSMDSPELVYLSGIAFLTEAEKREKQLTENLQALQAGKRTFETEEAKQKRKTQEEEDLGRAGYVARNLHIALDQYTKDTLLNPPYRQILRELYFWGNRKELAKVQTANNRKKVYGLVSEGKIDDAAAFLQNIGVWNYTAIDEVTVQEKEKI
ncbi:hypothetical protein HGB07_05835 [Candidatus Roizmanbacteria bacterium]|nr:hypothetical protein [Candidatus Roizmanbacteria bacterium]